jgi:hypothetical protein
MKTALVLGIHGAWIERGCLVQLNWVNILLRGPTLASLPGLKTPPTSGLSCGLNEYDGR